MLKDAVTVVALLWALAILGARIEGLDGVGTGAFFLMLCAATWWFMSALNAIFGCDHTEDDD